MLPVSCFSRMSWVLFLIFLVVCCVFVFVFHTHKQASSTFVGFGIWFCAHSFIFTYLFVCRAMRKLCECVMGKVEGSLGIKLHMMNKIETIFFIEHMIRIRCVHFHFTCFLPVLVHFSNRRHTESPNAHMYILCAPNCAHTEIDRDMCTYACDMVLSVT